jgi:hypothetical protein
VSVCTADGYEFLLDTVLNTSITGPGLLYKAFERVHQVSQGTQQ